MRSMILPHNFLRQYKRFFAATMPNKMNPGNNHWYHTYNRAVRDKLSTAHYLAKCCQQRLHGRPCVHAVRAYHEIVADAAARYPPSLQKLLGVCAPIVLHHVHRPSTLSCNSARNRRDKPEFPYFQHILRSFPTGTTVN